MTDRQISRQTDRQTDREADIQVYRIRDNQKKKRQRYQQADRTGGRGMQVNR